MKFLFFVVLIALFFVPALIGGIDAATKPSPQWQRSGQNQMLWVLGQLLGAFLCGIVGLVFAIIYFTSIRPQVMAAAGPPPAPPPGVY